jgi:hypothetical protein
MKHSTQLLIASGLLVSSLLGGLVSAILVPVPAAAARLEAMQAQVKVTTLPVIASTLPNISNTWTRIHDVGNFMVANPGSLVEVTFQGRLSVASMTGNGVIFELRVDNASPGYDSGQGLVELSQVNMHVSNTFSGYWSGLSAGLHTVSIWVSTEAQDETGTVANMNPGGWPSTIVIVKEYLPVGSTYLPVMQR